MTKKFSFNRIVLSFFLTFSLLLNVAQTASAEIISLKAPRSIVWKDFLGVNAHLLWFEPAQYLQQMQRVRELGLQWVRIDIHWNQHETVEGVYQVSELDTLISHIAAAQLKSVIYVAGTPRYASSGPVGDLISYDQYPPTDPQYLANFMNYLATRYPSVNAWQIWNEPNLLSYWRTSQCMTPANCIIDPAQYAYLFQTVKAKLLSTDPARLILAAGMPYFTQLPQGGFMLKALSDYGVLGSNMITAYHPYSHQPEGDTSTTDPQNFIHDSIWFNAYLRKLDPFRPIWITEWGWSSYQGTDDQMQEQPYIGTDGQADYTLRRLALMSAFDYDKIFLFALSDLDARASFRDRSYGLLDLDGQPKPVYNALKNFLIITGATLTPANPPQFSSSPDDLYSITWKRADGKTLWIGWSASSGAVVLPGVKKATLYNPMTSTQGIPLSNPKGIRVSLVPQVRMLVW